MDTPKRSDKFHCFIVWHGLWRCHSWSDAGDTVFGPLQSTPCSSFLEPSFLWHTNRQTRGGFIPLFLNSLQILLLNINFQAATESLTPETMSKGHKRPERRNEFPKLKETGPRCLAGTAERNKETMGFSFPETVKYHRHQRGVVLRFIF